MKHKFGPPIYVDVVHISTHRTGGHYTAPEPRKRPVVYIAGPITGVPGYHAEFGAAEARLAGAGYIPLNPARLPEGMTKAQYMRICFAMIDSADAVLLLPGSYKSDGCTVEYTYAKYIGKPTAHSIDEVKAALNA
jgi:nucleoside 2-deoxyribosyltransferase